MPPGIPVAPVRCIACDRGHYVAVRFCPFCGAEQARPMPPAPPPPPTPTTTPQGANEAPPIDIPPEVVPPSAAPPEEPPAPPVAEPDPVPPKPIWTARPVRRRRGRLVRLRQAGLALAAIVGLVILALARRDVVPAPTRIEVGPAWTSVALKSFRDVPSLRITAEGTVSLRIDGERVQRVSPANGATVRPKTLKSLELRAGRGLITVMLTPRGE